MLTLLVLSPVIGELLSGSSPPSRFFNPVAFMFMVGLYGCGAVLIRETAVRRNLGAAGVLLLGAAYGVLEEGLTCKSFFNPFWTDTGYLSIYGRALGVNWVWAFGLTFYHMVVSITVPIFLVEAIFPEAASEPWLRKRGLKFASAALSAVVLLGFLFFDNRQFHLIEIKDAQGLAAKLTAPSDPVAAFIASQVSPKDREVLRKAVVEKRDSPEVRHSLQNQLNSILPREGFYSRERFSQVALPPDLASQATHPPHGDKLIEFNRALIEQAMPGMVATRFEYPYRLSFVATLGCLGVMLVLVMLALRQPFAESAERTSRTPWLTGFGVTLLFVLLGFIVPALAEHGVPFPAVLDCALWCLAGAWVRSVAMRLDTTPGYRWLRGLWALGVLSPWIGFAALLGTVVQITGGKSFSGMTVVAFVFALSIFLLVRRWRKKLHESNALGPPEVPVALESTLPPK